MPRTRTTAQDILGVLQTSPEYDRYMREVSNDLVDAAKHAFKMQEDKTNQAVETGWSPPRYLASFGVERGAPMPSRRAKKPLPEEVRELTFVVFNDDTDNMGRTSNALAVEFGVYSAKSKSGVRLKYRPLGLGIDTLVNRAS